MTFGRAWLAALALVAPLSAETAAHPPALTMAEARRLVADREALVLDLSAVEQLEPDVADVVAEFPGLLDLSGLAEVGPDVAAALAGCTGLLDLSGVATLTPETAAALARCRGDVDLSGLRSMTPETARALGGYRGRQLRLTFAALGPDFDGSVLKDDLARAAVDWLDADAFSGRLTRLTAEEVPLLRALMRTPAWSGDLRRVARLDAEVATVLAEFKGDMLLLGGLETLDAATARALAEYRGTLLSLDGLTTFDAEAAEALAGFEGKWLSLFGLTTLNADAVTALERRKCVVMYPFNRLKGVALADSALLDDNLGRLTSLDPDSAKALAGFKGDTLDLNGLSTLDAPTAKALAEYKGQYLSLNGLTTLDAATAKALAEFKGEWLSLGGLKTLDAASANALAGLRGLSISGLTALDAATANSLAEYKGKTLQLLGLTTLDAATAEALALIGQWDGRTSLTAFESPDSVAIAKALAARKGPLSLPNLKKISPKTLSALLEKQDIDIPLIETLELIPEPDGSPNEDFVIPERFQNR